MTEFLDAQEQHKLHPDTFEVPSDITLSELNLGQWVKICDNKERFWVEVKDVNGEKITGRVDNDLVFEHDFKCDDTIDFEKRHIMATYTPGRV